MQNRPGDQVREERGKQRVTAEVLLHRAALLQVDQIGDLREGEERDAERQHHVTPVMQGVRPAREKVQQWKQVLEVAQRAEVDCDREDEDDLRVDVVCDTATDQRPGHVVEQDRRTQQNQKRRSPVCIKCKRDEGQPEHNGAPVEARSKLIAQQRERQECKQKNVRIEQHTARELRFFSSLKRFYNDAGLGRLRACRLGVELLFNKADQVTDVVQRLHLDGLELDLHPHLDSHDQIDVVGGVPIVNIGGRGLRCQHEAVIVEDVAKDLCQLAIDAGCIHASPFSIFMCVGRGL